MTTIYDDLFAAIAANDAARVRALLAAQPDLAGARTADGVSTVRYAYYYGHRELAPLLLAAGYTPDIFDAAALGDAARLRDVLAAQPELARAYSGDGFTALHYVAFFSGDEAAARALLDAGADPNAVARNRQRVTPLHSAMPARHDTVARLLIERGADVNARQQRGATALMEAALTGNAAMVDGLLAHDAQPDLALEDGRTAADLARENGHTEIAARIERAAEQ
jgi:ankyrin repeat protein